MTVDEVGWLPEAREDLTRIQERTPADADRIAEKVGDIVEKVKLWGREPRTHSNWSKVTDPDIPDIYNVYRRWIGAGDYRLFAEISETRMTIVAIRAKKSSTYENLGEIENRLEEDDGAGG